MSNMIVIRTGPDGPEDDDEPKPTATTTTTTTATAAKTGVDPVDDDDEDEPEGPVGLGDRFRHMLTSGDSKDPLYPRLLRLRHIHPSAWQRAFLVEGMAITGGLVALADKATSWAPVILPVAAAGIVKFHDVLVGLLPPRPPRQAEDDAPDS